jgi:hypothetical protein
MNVDIYTIILSVFASDRKTKQTNGWLGESFRLRPIENCCFVFMKLEFLYLLQS